MAGQRASAAAGAWRTILLPDLSRGTPCAHPKPPYGGLADGQADDGRHAGVGYHLFGRFGPAGRGRRWPAGRSGRSASSRSPDGSRRSPQPRAAEARPVLQGHADRRQLPRGAGRRTEDPPHAGRPRLRARGRPAGRVVDERPGHREVRAVLALRAAPPRRRVRAASRRRGGHDARAVAAAPVVRQEDEHGQGDDPHRHAAGHVPRGLPGEGLRVLDREAREDELQVLLGRPEPRRRRRRREVGRTR